MRARIFSHPTAEGWGNIYLPDARITVGVRGESVFSEKGRIDIGESGLVEVRTIDVPVETAQRLIRLRRDEQALRALAVRISRQQNELQPVIAQIVSNPERS
jgi:hypothetical protein